MDIFKCPSCCLLVLCLDLMMPNWCINPCLVLAGQNHSLCWRAPIALLLDSSLDFTSSSHPYPEGSQGLLSLHTSDCYISGSIHYISELSVKSVVLKLSNAEIL